MRTRLISGLLGVVSLMATILVASAPAAHAVNTPLATVVSANPAETTPWVQDGTVYAILPVGDTIYVGGDFTTVQEPTNSVKQSRPYLFAYDRTTGRLSTTWLPVVDGQVNALKATPDGGILIGGNFKNVNGVATVGLVKVQPDTGATVTTFNAGLNGFVNDVAVNGSNVYVGGSFTKARNIAASLLAGLDATTGKSLAGFNIPVTTPLQGTPSVGEMDVSADGSRLVIIGNFKSVGGLSRVQLAVIDLTTSPASVANWATPDYVATACNSVFWTYMRGVSISTDGTYFVVTTTGSWRGTSTLCDTSARWDLNQTGTTLHPTWVDWTGGDTQQAVAVTPAAVYIGGHMRWENNSNPPNESAGPGYVDRQGLAALDPATGVPLTWSPARDRGVGVFAMVTTPDGLYIGDDTDNVGGEWHPRLAFFPADGVTTNPVLATASLPADLYSGDSSGTLSGRGYDGTTFTTTRTVNTTAGWSSVKGAFLLNGSLFTVNSDGHTYSRSFDGSTGTVGATTDLNAWTSFSKATGMAYVNGRLYYTVAGDSRLYMRYFSPQSGIVGSMLFTVSGNGDGRSWNNVVGLTYASGNLYAATKDGNLHAIGFTATGTGATLGTDAVVSGPGVDGRSWASTRLLFFGPSTALGAAKLAAPVKK